MPNPYHDELGRFCSRTEMQTAITRLAISGNTKAYLELKQDYDEAEKETITPKDISTIFNRNSSILQKYNEDVGVEFIVQDAWGDSLELTGGDLNDDARWVFRNGQCLALASELAKATGTNKLAILVHPVEDDMLAVDDETGELLLDENGEPYPYVYEGIVHAYAVTSDGQLCDIDGNITEQDATTNGLASHSNGKLIKLNINEAQMRYEGYLSEQEYDFARTFVTTLLPEEAIKA